MFQSSGRQFAQMMTKLKLWKKFSDVKLVNENFLSFMQEPTEKAVKNFLKFGI